MHLITFNFFGSLDIYIKKMHNKIRYRYLFFKNKPNKECRKKYIDIANIIFIRYTTPKLDQDIYLNIIISIETYDRVILALTSRYIFPCGEN